MKFYESKKKLEAGLCRMAMESKTPVETMFLWIAIVTGCKSRLTVPEKLLAWLCVCAKLISYLMPICVMFLD